MNIGYAIRTLGEEFPELFYRELSFDIYRFKLSFLFNYCVLWTNNPFGFRENDKKPKKILISYMSCFDFCSKLLPKVYRFKFFESNVLRWFD